MKHLSILMGIIVFELIVSTFMTGMLFATVIGYQPRPIGEPHPVGTGYLMPIQGTGYVSGTNDLNK